MNSMWKNLLSSKAYRRSFFSFVALLTAVIAAVSLFYYFKFHLPQRRATDQNVQMRLSQIEEQLNKEISDMTRIVLTIDATKANGVFTYAVPTSAAQITALQQELTHYISNNSFVQDMAYISMKDPNQIYSTRGVLQRSSFEKYVYSATEEFDEASFSQRNRSLTPCIISSQELQAHYAPFDAMALVYGLPFMSTNQRRFVVFFIDKAQVDTLIQRLLPCAVEDVRIYERDTLIYSMYGTELPKGLKAFSLDSSSTAYRYHL